MEPTLFVLLRLGKPLVADVGDWQKLADVHARNGFERLRVGHDVDAAAHQQVADHVASDGIESTGSAVWPLAMSW